MRRDNTTDAADMADTADTADATPSTIPPTTTTAPPTTAPPATQPQGDRSIGALSDAAHIDTDRLIEASQHAEQVAGDPRRSLLASDAAVAAVSAHLAVMEAMVYPEIGSRVPGGKAQVRELRRQGREIDSVARGIEQVIYGDVHRPTATIAALREELASLMGVHAQAEDPLVAELDQVLTDAEQRRLAAKVEAHMRHAPTRPHPRLHFPTRLANRFAMNVAGRWDHVLDTMDARSAAGTPVREPAPPGLWGWYLLGRPTSTGSADSTTAGDVPTVRTPQTPTPSPQ